MNTLTLAEEETGITNTMRSNWQTELKGANELISTEIANSFAKQIFNQMETRLSNRHQFLATSKHKIRDTIDLKIYNKQSFKEFVRLSTTFSTLSFFQEWEKTFVLPPKNVDEENPRQALPDVERNYYDSLMAPIGALVETKLNEAFTRRIQDPRHKDQKFSATWIKKSDPDSNSCSSYNPYFSPYTIVVESWVDNKVYEGKEHIQPPVVNPQKSRSKFLLLLAIGFIVGILLLGLTLLRNNSSLSKLISGPRV